MIRYALFRFRPDLIPNSLLNRDGADKRDRTAVASLEGWCSAIELHRHICPATQNCTGAHITAMNKTALCEVHAGTDFMEDLEEPQVPFCLRQIQACATTIALKNAITYNALWVMATFCNILKGSRIVSATQDVVNRNFKILCYLAQDICRWHASPTLVVGNHILVDVAVYRKPFLGHSSAPAHPPKSLWKCLTAPSLHCTPLPS